MFNRTRFYLRKSQLCWEEKLPLWPESIQKFVTKVIKATNHFWRNILPGPKKRTHRHNLGIILKSEEEWKFLGKLVENVLSYWSNIYLNTGHNQRLRIRFDASTALNGLMFMFSSLIFPFFSIHFVYLNCILIFLFIIF